ncbi:MAG: phospholipase D-like domain-containing protein, partial [Actinomycetota bacterium]|nr:phospholipase D-like domain-containing protein [Actinomycetota bacterium]
SALCACRAATVTPTGNAAPAATTTAPGGPPSPYRVVTEPGDGLGDLYALISNAAVSIEVTMYELADSRAEALLVAAAARRVTVRVILDRNREAGANQAAFTFLSTRGVQVRWAPPRFAATHQKTIIVDGATAAILTLNLTSRYYPTSRDFAVIDSAPADVAALHQVFEADFAGTPITPSARSAVVWSPGSQPALVALIGSARSTVAVENEEMSAPDIVAALAAAARRNVHVTVTMTDSTAWAAAFATLRAAGVDIGVYHGETPIYIHAKVVAVDAATAGGHVFVGSENFTVASLAYNREAGIIVADRSVVTSVNATLGRDFAGATRWQP